MAFGSVARFNARTRAASRLRYDPRQARKARKRPSALPSGPCRDGPEALQDPCIIYSQRIISLVAFDWK